MTLQSKIGIVILAAGGSTRLGSPKQLLLFNNKNLLQHTIDAALTSMADDVVIVLGAHSDTIKASIHIGNAHCVANENWIDGLSSSIRCGLSFLKSINPHIEAAILVLCDQPFLDSIIIDAIIKKYRETQSRIIQCRYQNGYGPPTLFSKNLFTSLADLKGSDGAKSIVRQHGSEVRYIDFPNGECDIDTKEDYVKLLNARSNV